MFNPDGSIKLPNSLQASKDKKANRMKNTRCLRLKRDLVNLEAPKACILHIKVSDNMQDHRFLDTIFKQKKTETPLKLKKISPNDYEVHVGTSFRRCSECTNLISEYKSFLHGNLIDEKGSCTYEPRSFNYEDHFD